MDRAKRRDHHANLSRAKPLVLAFLLLLAGCAGWSSPRWEGMILARVNGETITAQDLEEAFNENHKGHGVLLAEYRMVRRFLERVIDQQLLWQEARRIGLDRAPEVERAVENFKQNRAREAFFQEEVRDRVLIPEEAIRASYEKMGVRFQARHILVESRAQAEKAWERIKAGETFSQVARQVSHALTARRGGDLGIVQWGQLDPPALEEKLWALGKGEMSEPFETEEGWNLLWVVERMSVKPPPLEEVRTYIRNVLTRRAIKRRSKELFQELMARWGGEIYTPVLQELSRGSPARELPPTAVVATIAGEKIDVGHLGKVANLEKIRELPPEMAFRLLQRLLERELFSLLLAKEAMAQGYGERPEIVRDSEKLREDLAIDLLLKRVIFADFAGVSAQEVEDYYRTHREKFTEPEAVQVSIIPAETEEMAQKAVAALQTGEDAITLPGERQMTLSARRGWIKRGEVDPALEEVAFSLPEGEIGTVKVPLGYYVVRVEEKRAKRQKLFREVREEARRAALQQKYRDVLKQWITKLRERSSVQVDEAMIEQAIAAYEASIR